MVVRIAPSRLYYAAIRINPMAMVQDLGLDDSQTLTEAQGLTNRTYLVLLTMPGELPMPGMRWCRYTIEPIGTTVRTADPDCGITADMVIPIVPNAAHARGHEPVQPSSPFPFANCFHWIDNDVMVRIRVPPCGGFEHDGAIRLSVKERSALMREFEEDYDRIGDFARRSRSMANQTSDEPESVDDAERHIEGCSTQELSEAYRRYVEDKGVTSSSPLASLLSRRTPSFANNDQTSASATTDACSAESLDSDFVHLFGQATDPTNGLIPLVDCWLDIDKHLTAETIPSPDELEKEVEQVVELIKRGVARRLLSERHTRARTHSVAVAAYVALRLGRQIRVADLQHMVSFALSTLRRACHIVGSSVLLPLARKIVTGTLVFAHRVAAARYA